jgi:O-antigen/teichoic acid export membrane protein
MAPKKLSVNVAANIFQAVMTALTMFVLYRYISLTLGIEQLGVWSLVVAAASSARLAEFGLGAAVTRHVAKDIADGKPSSAMTVIDSVTIALFLLVGVAVALLFPVIAWGIKRVIEPKNLDVAISLLPMASLSLFLAAVSAVSQSALDGLQRMDLRAALVVASQVLLLGISILLTPKYGLAGLALAQTAQSACLAVFGRILVRSRMVGLSVVPLRFSGESLKRILPYGLNSQVAAICLFLLDPIAKFFLAKFGGSVSVGYFEIANQIVTKTRSLVVSATQAIVPMVASIPNSEHDAATKVYVSSVRAVTFFAGLLAFALIMLADIYSNLISGAPNRHIQINVFLLAVAWFVNTVSTPAYFMNLAQGDVVLNTINHLIMSALNIFLGVILGSAFGGFGVIVGYCCAIAASSVFVIYAYHSRKNVQHSAVFGSQDRFYIAGLSVIALIVQVAHLLIPQLSGLHSALFNALATIAAFWLFFTHSVGKQIWYRLKKSGIATR